MKEKISRHYEKVTLFLALLTMALFVAFVFLQEIQIPERSKSNESGISIRRTDLGLSFETNAKHNLMPGHFLYYKPNEESSEFKKVEILEIFFKRRSQIQLQLLGGKIVDALVKNKEGLRLEKEWKKSNGSTLLDIEGSTRPIQFRNIESIYGSPKYLLSDKADLTELRNTSLHLYQIPEITSFNLENSNRPLWKNLSYDKNESIYDLFTPPLIYLIEGKLSTTLPEAPVEEEEKEPFGVKIVSFDKKAYRFRLNSWIGDSPYLEDIILSKETGRTVRNKLVVNGIYALDENFRPGRPSLKMVDENSSDKLISLKYFTVQKVTQKNGGTKPVGRALIEDYKLGGKPFEINSLMEEVFLGQFEVGLEFKIKKEDPMLIKVSDSQVGQELLYNGRSYLILGFDVENKSIRLRKNGAIPALSEDLELILP